MTRMSPRRPAAGEAVRPCPPPPPTRTTAVSGARANRSAVAFRARSRVLASRKLARAKRVTTTPASAHSPIRVAPPMEIVIRVFIPRERFPSSLAPRTATRAPPTRMEARKSRFAHGEGAKAGEDLLEIAPVADLDLAGKKVEDGLLHPPQAAQRGPDLLLLVRAIHRGDEDPRDGDLPVGFHRFHIT